MGSFVSSRWITSSLSRLRAVRWRNWITCLQDHYLSGDDPYWQANRDSGPIHQFRQQLQTAPAVFGDPRVTEFCADAERHIGKLDSKTSFRFRFLSFVWSLLITGWALALSILTDDWAQFIAQLMVWSRNDSIAVSRIRYERTSGGIVFKFYEDRVVGDIPAFLLYTIILLPGMRYLLKISSTKWIVGSITGLWLLLVSYIPVLWFFCRFTVWRLGLFPTGPLEAKKNACKTFSDSFQAFLDHIENADIGDAMRQHFLRAKKSAERALKIMHCHLHPEDRPSMPRYSSGPKTPLFLIAAGLQAFTLYATRDASLLFPISLGWAIWIIARISVATFNGRVSGDDAAFTFSNIVAGSITLLPLTVSLAIIGEELLKSNLNIVLLSISHVLLANLFSNLVGFVSLKLAKWIMRKLENSGTAPVENTEEAAGPTT
jgi:hypothetical protein